MKNRFSIQDLSNEIALGFDGLLPEDRGIFLYVADKIIPVGPESVLLDVRTKQNLDTAWANYERSLNY